MTVTLSCLPSNPWAVTPGVYARPDGSAVHIGGREQFWDKRKGMANGGGNGVGGGPALEHNEMKGEVEKGV